MPKFHLGIKLSRLDALSLVQTIAKVVGQDDEAAFVHQAVGRVERIMGREYPTERKNLREVRAVKKRVWKENC